MANNFSPETSPESTSKIAKRPTISDIARAAGVSIAVVSYALNGKNGVSPATRDRVLRIANEYGWRPSAAARSLRTSPKTVGLALVDYGHSSTQSAQLVEFVAGVQSTLASEDLSLMVQVVDSVEIAAQLFTTWWAERRFDGFLITDVTTDDPRVHAVTKHKIPAVAIAHPESSAGGAYVWVGEEEAYAGAVKTLAGLGHQHIALLNGQEVVEMAQRRALAARIEGARHGVRISVNYSDSAENTAASARALLSAPDRPTALIFSSDTDAVTGIDVARRLNLSVPWDVSIVGFGISASSQLSLPSLTSVTFAHREVGKLAGATLIRVLKGEVRPFEKYVLPNMTVRGSTAPAPSTEH